MIHGPSDFGSFYRSQKKRTFIKWLLQAGKQQVGGGRQRGVEVKIILETYLDYVKILFSDYYRNKEDGKLPVNIVWWTCFSLCISLQNNIARLTKWGYGCISR